MFLNNCLKVVGAAVTYFYGVFIEDFVVAVFFGEMLADQVQKFSSDVCLHRFNKNTVKVSYSCTDNLQTIIKKHNRKILETNTNTTISTEKNCNCRKKKDCPLKNNCLTSSVIYNANVTTESDAAGMNYIGLTEGTFKQRYTQHKLSFRNRNYSNSTELSKHIWMLKDSNTNYKID